MVRDLSNRLCAALVSLVILVGCGDTTTQGGTAEGGSNHADVVFTNARVYTVDDVRTLGGGGRR